MNKTEFKKQFKQAQPATRIVIGLTEEQREKWIEEVMDSLIGQGAEPAKEDNKIVCNNGQWFNIPALSSEEKGTLQVRSKDVVFTRAAGTKVYCDLVSLSIGDDNASVIDTNVLYKF